MRLRGPVDKGDPVSAALLARTLQRQLRALETDLAKRHVWMEENFHKLEVVIANLSTASRATA